MKVTLSEQCCRALSKYEMLKFVSGEDLTCEGRNKT